MTDGAVGLLLLPVTALPVCLTRGGVSMVKSQMSSDSVSDVPGDDEYDGVREANYEFTFCSWFNFDEEKTFKLSLLPMKSSWRTEEVPLSRNEHLIKRKLVFSPSEATTNWSISINVSDMIIGDNRRHGKEKKTVRGPHKKFLNLTATNENPFIEFEYIVKETEKEKLITNEQLFYYCNVRITVVDCRNLSGYLNKCVDFTLPFPASNAILEMDDGKRLYFVLEALSIQSTVFYKFLEEKEALEKEGDHYVVKMEDTDIIAMIIILKLMTYKEHNSHDESNVERVAFTAKKWKFEMILAACEDLLIKRLNISVGSSILKLTYLAHQYDMSQLQTFPWDVSFKSKKLASI